VSKEPVSYGPLLDLLILLGELQARAERSAPEKSTNKADREHPGERPSAACRDPDREDRRDRDHKRGAVDPEPRAK
jgi:hypothetical protein